MENTNIIQLKDIAMSFDGEQVLSDEGYSAFDEERWAPEPPKSKSRTAFERDRARLIHSSALRRLGAKSQILIAGTDDFARTRLTHTLEVAQIAHTLARALRLDKMTLAALHATLRAYLDTDTAAREIPTLAMLSAGEGALREKALTAAEQCGTVLRRGVYIGVNGPQFETPAEIRAFRTLGADAVGMSTVFEVIAAAHCGLPVLGIAMITNMAAGVLNKPLSGAEVNEIAEKRGGVFREYVKTLVKTL